MNLPNLDPETWCFLTGYCRAGLSLIEDLLVNKQHEGALKATEKIIKYVNSTLGLAVKSRLEKIALENKKHEERVGLLALVDLLVGTSMYMVIETENTINHIERLSPTCKDRGAYRWIAEAKPKSKVVIDGHDMFPRLYFSFECLEKEINSWLIEKEINSWLIMRNENIISVRDGFSEEEKKTDEP